MTYSLEYITFINLRSVKLSVIEQDHSDQVLLFKSKTMNEMFIRSDYIIISWIVCYQRACFKTQSLLFWCLK